MLANHLITKKRNKYYYHYISASPQVCQISEILHTSRHISLPTTRTTMLRGGWDASDYPDQVGLNNTCPVYGVWAVLPLPDQEMWAWGDFQIMWCPPLSGWHPARQPPLSQLCAMGNLRSPAVSSLCNAVLSACAYIANERFQLSVSSGAAFFHFLVMRRLAVMRPRSRNL